MSEARTRPSELEPVAPGLFRWHVSDERLGGVEGEAYALVRDGRVVLIDPHRMAAAKLRTLGRVEAIVLTIQSHQRSAWRHRRTFGVPVWAPRGAVGLEEEPDHWYGDGDRLPGGLTAMHAPGPCDASYFLITGEERPIAFTGDVAIRSARGRLTYPDAAYQDDPALSPKSVARLAKEVPVAIACFGHGDPMMRNARRALESLSHRSPP